ncbi:MAG TPA: cation:proton antiporter [Candidatus Binatia bacterium]|nr:cation:proton antiporter [Candidatus Binatia bacterium]
MAPVQLFAEVIVLLAVAAVGLLAGRALRLPSIVAYLVAGVLAGPGGLGLVGHSEAIDQLAELGVALLLFGVGIEFSLERLRRILPRMLACGALQVTVTVAATALAFRRLGGPWPGAVFLGFLVSLSSTAIVFKLYDERGELDAPQGLAAAGVLLFQDLALVPMVLLVPVLAGPDGRALLAARALAAALVAVTALLVLARAVLPRALAWVARAGAPELFPLAALVIAFGTALGASKLGLSLPIGAFLAGLALSGSPYAHQVFAELLPLRDAFVAIFFTGIGLLLRPAVLASEPAVLAGMLAAVAFKGALVGTIVALAWRSARLGVVAGLGLAQIGEFSFVLGRQGVAAGVLSTRHEQAFLGAAILTMAATPFLVEAAHRLALLGAHGRGAGAPQTLHDHVLVIGYGVTGQAVARVLRETGLSFAAVDVVAESVAAGRAEGMPVRFGDATRRAVLEQMGAGRARAAVIAVTDPSGTRRIVALLRQMNPSARILVRVRRVAEIAELERLGADEVVPSEFETSIELFVRLLGHLGVPRHVARVQESLIRLGHYQALRGVGATPELLAETRRIVMGGILESAQVMPGSAAAGRTLGEIALRRRTGANVLSVVKNGAPQPTPDGSTRLDAGDLVVLYGPHEAIDRALELLEPRPSGGG